MIEGEGGINRSVGRSIDGGGGGELFVDVLVIYFIMRMITIVTIIANSSLIGPILIGLGWGFF